MVPLNPHPARATANAMQLGPLFPRTEICGVCQKNQTRGGLNWRVGTKTVSLLGCFHPERKENGFQHVVERDN
jgi:hypothetical protein